MSSELTARFIKWLGVVVPTVLILLALAFLLPAIQLSREAQGRSQSRNNLRQLGLALQEYHDVFSTSPYGGVIGSDGTPYYSWTTALDLLLSQRAYYDMPDPNLRWDDPVNIDKQIHEFAAPFQNPGLSELRSEDGLPLAHNAANQNLFYRNSVVRLGDIPDLLTTALVGEANGNFIPIGCPYNWRDLSLGLRSSSDAFGCPARPVTMFTMADSSVKALNNKTDAQIARTLAGPAQLTPTFGQTAKPSAPYRLKTREYWRYLNVVRAHKSLMTFRLSPDQKYLGVDFRNYDDPDEAVAEKWNSYFQRFAKTASIEHIELSGNLRANELLPFLAIPTLKRLSIHAAHFADDEKETLASARREIVID